MHKVFRWQKKDQWQGFWTWISDNRVAVFLHEFYLKNYESGLIVNAYFVTVYKLNCVSRDSLDKKALCI